MKDQTAVRLAREGEIEALRARLAEAEEALWSVFGWVVTFVADGCNESEALEAIEANVRAYFKAHP